MESAGRRGADLLGSYAGALIPVVSSLTSVHPDSSAKLAKADEFLSVADVALGAECFDAAVSLAVSAAVNASDALCLEAAGRYSTTSNHADALALLRQCGVAGTSASKNLQRVLKLKTKAQYSSNRCKAKEAEDAYMYAERVLSTVKTWIKQNGR